MIFAGKKRRYKIPGRTFHVGGLGFFSVFDFKLLKGNPQTALKEPFSIVFSEPPQKNILAKQIRSGKLYC